MVKGDEEQPFWRHFEEAFLIRWLYEQGHSWKITMGEAAVAGLIKELEEKLRKRYPRGQRSATEILRKIGELRDDYVVFVDFMSAPSVRFDGKRPTIYSWDAYHKSVCPQEPRRFRRCRRYGINHWSKQKFLFDGGYLAVVDLDFVALYP